MTGLPSQLRPVTAFGNQDVSRVLTLPTAGISCPFAPGSVTLVRSYGLPFTISGDAVCDQVYTMEDGPLPYYLKFGGVDVKPGSDEFFDPEPMDFDTMMYQFEEEEEYPGYDTIGIADPEISMFAYESAGFLRWHKQE